MSDTIDRLLQIMARLRDPQDGCDWDLAQDFSTIAPYTLEEAYEVADAIERGDMAELKEELGDLLLQVVFHSRMAEEAGHFNFGDVVKSISDKMEARHPHIFGDEGGSMGEARWEALKAKEREAKGASSTMDGVALALPALQRAEKLQKRASRDGFDWGNTEGPTQKIHEEIAELAEAPDDKREEEAGDLLFAVVNLVRAYGIAPETALRRANLKFEKRYRTMERLAEGSFPELSLDEQEELWQSAKRAEADSA
ncbi:nucleoside triphosphate pyrophosphohydrolase [Erythrobacter sp. HKB08]|uniref:nucleoside triphosphate pyrophosphohydrolase n=1 Tax=Erythrobacter sp. HKB08 TaxID=2502843 RepID=UPI0010092864|nr:nucleoside triphosphate pyrophosphohydrolase [Erythrobacter sp. HKB08]